MADELAAKMEDGKQEKQIVQFTKSHLGYNAGEIAGFIPKKAKGLLDLKVVRFITYEQAMCIEKGLPPPEEPKAEKPKAEEPKDEKKRGRRGG